MSEEREKSSKFFAKAVASVAICAAGAYCMWLTQGRTGIGWACFGLFLVWGT